MTEKTIMSVAGGKEKFLIAFEEYLKGILDKCAGTTGEAMRYATLDGGKRIRPLCVYYGAEASGGADLGVLLPLSLAIELIHSYSLVHDDMPEMDNDDYRRGKYSVHKRFGAARALLTGDGLLSLAMSELLKSDVVAAREIASAALDMVYGQSAELDGCASIDDWTDMYSKKTGALIVGAFRAGAITAGAGEQRLAEITEFAKRIGLAFQLSDDLLDDDPSIVSVIGRYEAKRMLNEQSEAAKEIALGFENSAEIIDFANTLQNRRS